jgi:ferredoxin
MPVNVCFLPDRLTIAAEAGEPLLNVAERAGIDIPTGCLMGSCFACEVEIDGEPVRACLAAVPTGKLTLTVRRYDDPVW